MKNGKEAIATVLGCDIADIERYQDTRIRGVYTDGTDYYASRKVGKKKLPDGYKWTKIAADWFERQYKIEVFKADGSEDNG